MNIETVEDEVYDFNALFFKDIDAIVESGIEFIEKNDLYQPKENYLILVHYLDTTINHFKNLDYTVLDETIKKLHRDINLLHSLYEKKQEQALDIKDIFQSKFLKKETTFKSLSTEILQYKKILHKSQEERLEYKRLITIYKELQHVYFEVFNELFSDDKKYYLHSILTIMNSKIFYLDRLLWMNVVKSEVVMRSLKDVPILGEHIDSKSYIAHRLKIIIPYSKDYKYLQKCLKVFK